MLFALLAMTLLAPSGPAPPSGSRPGLALAATPTGAALTIGTLPAVGGFPVTIDGITRVTDGNGRAQFPIPATTGDLADRLAFTEAVLPIGGRDVKVSVNRLYPAAPLPLVAVDLSYAVAFGFSSTSGAAIDESAITTLTVRSSVGAVADIPAHESSWLQGTRIVAGGEGLAVEPLQWSVQRVEYAGSNVVNSSQQRFRPADQQTVDVRLLFFSMDGDIHDALYGYTHGNGAVELVYPDGHARRLDVAPDGRFHVSALPRGKYTLTLLGPGPRMSRPLAISRDQDLDLAFYSWWDVGTILGALFGLALTLAIIGAVRRRRFARDTVPAAAGVRHRDGDVRPQGHHPGHPQGRHRAGRRHPGAEDDGLGAAEDDEDDDGGTLAAIVDIHRAHDRRAVNTAGDRTLSADRRAT